MSAIAPDGVITLHQRQEGCELADIELPIRIHEENQIVARGFEASDERCAVPTVDLVTNQADALVARCERGDDLARSVVAAVIDDYNLKLQTPPRERLHSCAHRRFDQRLLVVCR